MHIVVRLIAEQRMRLDPDLAAFIESPVMLILGTRDGRNRPEVGRATAALIAAEDRVDLVFCARQWPGTRANLERVPRLAATFSRPADYVTYQLKGAAMLRPATEAHLHRYAAYREEIAATLMALGLPRAVLAPWFLLDEPVVAALRVEAIFEQTPGARAGAPVAASS